MNKVLLSFFIFLFSFFCFSQSNLIGEWYLDSFVIDGNTYQNVYGNLPINFSDGVVFDNYLLFDGLSSCNAIQGEYTYANEEITFHGVGQTLVDCYPAPNGIYENYYISLLSNNYAYPSTFNFTIEGDGDDQMLTLTNSNGDTVIYSKAETNLILTRTWYLETLVDNGIEYNITSTESPSLSLSTDADYFFGNIYFSGNGNCNSFSGDYYIYSYNDGDKIRISNFVPTTDVCDPPNDFEVSYFSILEDSDANIFSFEIINNGDNLILSSVSSNGGSSVSTVGDVMTFSKQSLSITDFNNLIKTITIKENPVENQLKLKINTNTLLKDIAYKIFSIDGKLIKPSVLNSDAIDVSEMQSGIYFIRFMVENNLVSTLKFIKK